MEYDYANLFYFRYINRIGGTEQFLYEIAKRYHDRDIVVMYDHIDVDQLFRLRKYVKCVRREPGAKYRVKRAFYSYTTEIMPQVEADEHIFVCHAIYQKIMMEPPLAHHELTRWICVSKYALESLKKYAKNMGKEITPELSYNPLTLEEPDKVVRLISACRLEDTVKGGKRTLKLIEALDKYCEKTGKHYLWTIFTNTIGAKIDSPNVAIMPGREDVRPYIADSDWMVQLSDDMESYCYSINEALGYGTRIIRTPLSVAKELKFPKQAELVCEWDMSNADEIAEKVFEPKQDFVYTPPKDNWDKILTNDPSKYKPNTTKVLVRCVERYNDIELKKTIEPNSPPYEVTYDRARKLCRLGLCRIEE